MDLFECERMSAKITERQCEVNRSRCLSCKGCVGLGEPAQAPSIVREVEPVANIKKYICVENGCSKLQSKNRRCHIHNKAYLIQVRQSLKAGKKETGDQAGSPGEASQCDTCEGAADWCSNPGASLGGCVAYEAKAVAQIAPAGSELDTITADSFEPEAEPALEVPAEFLAHIETMDFTPKLTGLAALLRTPPPTGRAGRPADPFHPGRSHCADREQRDRRGDTRADQHAAGRRAAARSGGVTYGQIR